MPCLVRDVDSATELSLSENLLRQAMHPADEFAAFQAMIDDGMTQAEIAAHFGISIRRIRMRLAGAAPALIAHYRAGTLTLDDMMAFTVSQDHDKQMQCYEARQGRVTAWAVRRYLTEAAARSDEPIAKFVTVKAYKRSTDLFKVALAAIKSDKTLVERSEQFNVHAHPIAQWKNQLLDRAEDAFEGTGPREPPVDGKTLRQPGVGDGSACIARAPGETISLSSGCGEP